MGYCSSREASKTLGIHPNTLRRWADSGKIAHIKTAAGQRKYDVQGYLGNSRQTETVCYCRVSSPKQKDDLQRQVAFMQEKFPGAEIIKDIGSGISFKRKGLRSILERAMQGDKLKVVSAHRDRLCRFGFDLVKWIIEKDGGELVVFNDTRYRSRKKLVVLQRDRVEE